MVESEKPEKSRSFFNVINMLQVAKFGRLKTFVEELEKADFIENEETLLLIGSAGSGSPIEGSNNCQCSGSNNCQCYGGNNCQC